MALIMGPSYQKPLQIKNATDLPSPWGGEIGRYGDGEHQRPTPPIPLDLRQPTPGSNRVQPALPSRNTSSLLRTNGSLRSERRNESRAAVTTGTRGLLALTSHRWLTSC